VEKLYGDLDMKISDDYLAKVRCWARNPQVIPLPPGPPLPKFPSQRFRNHQEMNRWKAALLRRMAREQAIHG
jgi:hypothetical protein